MAMPAPVPPAAVQFADDRRPEVATRVQLESWEGPLGLLLSLIEARELDVLHVPLGALADAYLDALATLDADRLANVSAFVAVASQLILIKSRAMLPRPPEPDAAPGEGDDAPDPETELRARLILYRAFRDAGTALEVAAAGRRLHRREPAVAAASGVAGAVAPDAPPLDGSMLVQALAALAVIVVPPPPPPEVLGRVVTIRERAAAIREALRRAPTIVLQELLDGVRDRVVIVVTFLAMLELMKRREIVVEQDAPFGPIQARSTTEAERVAAGVRPDIEAAPIDESLESFA